MWCVAALITTMLGSFAAPTGIGTNPYYRSTISVFGCAVKQQE